ncbi:hypothetical protein LIER_07670 [Lithospermum erythrorhizon]|uniref:Uncharacterized protein n=1 Tax=Lithospermum erythrorhizon TaxID=34254 RepID=A0AAV3PA65_LITER
MMQGNEMCILNKPVNYHHDDIVVEGLSAPPTDESCNAAITFCLMPTSFPKTLHHSTDESCNAVITRLGKEKTRPDNPVPARTRLVNNTKYKSPLPSMKVESLKYSAQKHQHDPPLIKHQLPGSYCLACIV